MKKKNEVLRKLQSLLQYSLVSHHLLHMNMGNGSFLFLFFSFFFFTKIFQIKAIYHLATDQMILRRTVG